ncbi:MAG: four helix bundle protein [Candidatus Falkowbacteria bacterium]
MENKKIKNFYELEAWQKARDLTLQIYNITKTFPKEELFGITNQLRRASASIMANIAEGFARFHFKDKIKFYYMARASAAEVQSFLFLSEALRYIDQPTLQKLSAQCEESARLINGLINSINNNNPSY